MAEEVEKKIDYVIDKRVDSKRQRIKDKDLLETVEEVFDSFTLESLYHVMRKVRLKKLYGVVNAGKEARIYRAIDYNGREYAVKIYLTFTSEFKKGIWKYIMGDPRFENAKITSTRSLMRLWARKEYKNLQRMYRAGIRVPEPVYVHDNIVVMEFIGKDGKRAPLLKEVPLSLDEGTQLFMKIVRYIQVMYCKARLVHADLSEFNIMLPHVNDPVIIDVAQAVSIEHPNTDLFISKDVQNVQRFFKKEVGVPAKPPEILLEVITSCGRTVLMEDIMETGSL